jgi:hypothetical protein
LPVGSGRALRLDPQALPVRFTAHDAGADQQLRTVELSRERVVLHRVVSGIRMAVNVAVASFLGVAVRVLPEGVTISLEHRDPALSVPLFHAADSTDVVAEWQLWARVFALPLLVVDRSGSLREPFRRIGAVRVGSPAPRRRRRNAVRARRPTFLMRRRCGVVAHAANVCRGEREIIARD